MSKRHDTDYGLLLVRVGIGVFTIALILLVSHAAKPPARTATEQAAIEWAERHLDTKRVHALCDGVSCVVWGVHSWTYAHGATTPAIPLDCSANPCVMVTP